MLTANSVVKALPSVVLPLALLASLAHPRAVAGVPRSLADGGLGFVLGHEIWHSLDHSGRGFDLQGRLATVWDQASLARWHYREMSPHRALIHHSAGTLASPSV